MKVYLPSSKLSAIKFYFAFLIILIASPLYAQDGEALFKTNCTICHTIGSGKLLGPDLANVEMRRDKAWLNSFIKSSASVIASGDEVAVALFEEYNKIPMPDQPTFTDADVDALLAYIVSQSPEYNPESEAL